MFTRRHDFTGPFENEATDYGHLSISIDPSVIALFAIILVIVALVGIAAMHFAKLMVDQELEKQKTRSAHTIYNHIAYCLDDALKAQGASRIDKAHELKDVLGSRLGVFVEFHNRHVKALNGLVKALETKDLIDKPDGPPKPPEIKVDLGAEQLSLEVWNALQKFKTKWDQKSEILSLIKAAQDEMTQFDPKKPKLLIFNSQNSSKPVKKTGKVEKAATQAPAKPLAKKQKRA